MSSAPDNFVHTCSRCGQAVLPRGEDRPRFCAVCGLRVVPLNRDVQQALATNTRPAGLAIAALLLGLLSLVPMAGFPAGVAAIAVGNAARRRIRDSDGQLGGEGMAHAGILLGVVTSVLWLLICLGVRGVP
jgi:DNA-directed RNA polymerase subunit RPC12/RpoP